MDTAPAGIRDFSRFIDAFLTKCAVTRPQAPCSAGRETRTGRFGNRVFSRAQGGEGESRNLVADAGLAQALDIVIAIRLLFEGVDSGDLVDAEIGIQPL